MVAVAGQILDGHLGVGVAGDIGASLEADIAGDLPLPAYLFGEDQGRYLLTVPASGAAALLDAAAAAGVPARRIGTTGGADLTLPGGDPISVADLRAAHESWFPAYMATS